MSDQPIDIEAVFATALSKETPEQRAAYLDEACRNDAEARARVEALLGAHHEAGSFLEKPAAEFVPNANPLEATTDGSFGVLLDDISLDFLRTSDALDSLGRLGPYEITEVVGRGGMGIVLKGYDPKLNRIVAVKMLAPELASNASARKRFLREGRAAAAVSHDHVITIYGIDDGGTLPFIAMEYISGQSLEDRIKGEGSLELPEILRIGMQIASGLAAAHAQGLAHRDIKPANILLENGVEKVKITDFGLARAVDDVRMTKPGVVTGTPEYMSPEQARGESVDYRTDLFSLGCVLYAMCTGRPPFRAENTPAVIRRVCEDTPRPIGDVNSDIPCWLVQIIEELLEKNVNDRFQSASELAGLLGQCLAHMQQPSVNPLPERLESGRITRRRTGTRHRGWLAAAATLLIVLGGLSLTEATGLTDVTGTVIRIVRGNGTLVIRVDDPEVSVSIDGEQLVITGAGAKEIRLGVGQHELKAVRNGETVHTELVTVTRDGKRVVEVNAESLAPAEVVEMPESQETAVLELQETWPYGGLEELDVLSISRNGRYCTFLEFPSGRLMVRNLSTRADQRLTQEKVPRKTAYVSPNCEWVAYLGVGHKEPELELRVVGIDGTQERVLYRGEKKSRVSLRGWSPDSESLLVVLYDSEGGVSGLNSFPVRIATISVADASIRVLKSLGPDENAGVMPRFSPDGRYVAYDRVVNTVNEQEDIFLIPLDGGPEISLVESPADDDVFGWLPAGNAFLFRSDRRGRGDDIWMIQVVGGKPWGTPRLVRKGVPSAEAKYPLGPVRTPTRGWAFYYSDYSKAQKGTNPDVYIADFDLEEGRIVGEPRPASEQFRGDTCRTPGWSPDGQYLAYHTGSRTLSWPRYPTFVVIRSMQTGHERTIELGENRLPPGPLVWSPDGRSILLSSEYGRLGPLLRLEVESGAITPIGPHTDDVTPGNEQVPIGWSPDGKVVYARRNRYEQGKGYCNGQILMHNLDTGQETELYRDDDGIFDCHLSPDGSQIAYRASKGSSIMLMPTAGGEPRELFSTPDEEKIWYTVGWSPDGRHLLFWKVTSAGTSGQSSPTYELWWISAEGAQSEKLAWETQSKAYCLRLHPSGKQVAFTKGRSVTKNHIRMLQIVGLDELAKETCTANLRTIGSAIEQYKKDNGDVPDGFADLYPDYLQDPNLLLCPAERRGGEPLEGAKNPNMRCSYTYPFGPETIGVSRFNVALPVHFPYREGMTWTEARKLQMEYYGPVVPIAMCFQYHDGPLCLSYDGEIYDGEQDYWSWEKSPKAKAGLLSQLKAAMQSEPDTWSQRYDMQRFQCLLEDDVALTELLKTHLQEHPEDQTVRECLADMPRLRFIYDPCGDAEEDVDDGAVSWRNIDLDLIHDTDPDHNKDQVVGLRFQDIPVPQGARIKRVYVQFTASPENPGSEKTDLVLHAELAADAERFDEVKHNITSRRKTAASVAWSPEPWTVGGERSERQRTPDLSSLVQEVVDQPDWRKGNALVLIISGSGRRNAQPWGHASRSGAPMLYVEH